MKEPDIYADSLEQGMLDRLKGVKGNSKPKERSKDRNQYDDLEISAHGLKTQFAGQLEKLGDSDTRQQAMKQIQKLITDYCNTDTLRIYLSILKGLKKSVANSSTKEHEVLVIASICERYKTNLIDPIDKPPSLLKTAFRVIELIHSYFNDTAVTVQQACARALIDLYSCCLKNQPIDSKLSLVFLPLTSILTTGQDRMSQNAASVCISELVNYWYSKGELDIIRRIQKQLLFVFLKVNAEFYIIMDAISICLKISGLQYLEGKFTAFINKLLIFLSQQDRGPTAKAGTPLNSYMSKVQTCKMLNTIGNMIMGKQQYISQIKPLEILSDLDRASKNRLIQVQKAAHEALKTWRQVAGLENGPTQDKSKEAARPSPSFQLSNLNEMRQKFKRQKSKSKEYSDQTSKTREKIEEDLKFMKDDLSKLVKGKGWGPQNRGQNFIKKGTGVGGGQVGTMDTSPGTKNRKTHDEHIKQLRKFVQSQREARKTAPDFFPAFGNPNAAQPKSKSPKQKHSPSPQKALDTKVDLSEHIKAYTDKAQPVRPASAQAKSKQFLKPPAPFHSFDGHEFEVVEDHGEQAAVAVISIKNSESASLDTGRKDKQIPKKNMEEQLDRELHEELRNIRRDQDRPIKKQKPQNFGAMKDYVSKEQMQEFIDANSLSGVSSYLGGIINEDDIEQSKIQHMNSQILEKQPDYIYVRELKSSKKQSSLRETAEKFMKKAPPAAEIPAIVIDSKVFRGNGSLQYTQSKQKEHLQESMKFLELSKAHERRKEGDLLSHGQRQPSPEEIPEDIPSKIPEKAFRKSLYDFPKNTQPVLELPSLQRQKDEESSQEVQSDYEQSHRQPSPVRPASSPIPQLLKPVKPPNEQEEMKGKNFQNLIIKPPPPKTANSFAANRQEKVLDRKSNTAGNFMPKQVQPPEPQMSDNGLLEKWKVILAAVDQGQVNEAFQLAFQLDDSVYLLRLILLSGGCFDKLTVQNSKKLWSMFSEAYNSKYFDILILSMFTQANELSLIDKTLNLEDSNFLLQRLYQMSGQLTGRVSYRSAVLYNEIETKLRN